MLNTEYHTKSYKANNTEHAGKITKKYLTVKTQQRKPIFLAKINLYLKLSDIYGKPSKSKDTNL